MLANVLDSFSSLLPSVAAHKVLQYMHEYIISFVIFSLTLIVHFKSG